MITFKTTLKQLINFLTASKNVLFPVILNHYKSFTNWFVFLRGFIFASVATVVHLKMEKLT